MKQPPDIESDRATLVRLLVRAGLAEHATRILQSSTSALELLPVPGETTAGQFGGIPVASPRMSWPGDMRFLLDVNLACLTRLSVRLPRRGRLRFFVKDGFDEEGTYLGSGRVQLDTGRLGTTLTPPGVVDSLRGIEVRERLCIPTSDSLAQSALRLSIEERAKYNDEVFVRMPRPRHWLLGQSQGDSDDDEERRLLLSLGSDRQLGFRWGDDNRLEFTMPRDGPIKECLIHASPRYVDA